MRTEEMIRELRRLEDKYKNSRILGEIKDYISILNNLTVSDILNMYAGNIIETFDSTQYYYVENYVIKVKE